MLKLLELLIVVSRLIDFIIDQVVERQAKQDLEAVRIVVEEAKMARTREAKIASAKKIRDALSGS